MSETVRRETVIISGAGGGIGTATAQSFLDGSFNVVLVDLSEENLDRTVARLRAPENTVLRLPGDVSQEKTCQTVLSATLDRFGSVDVLVNNAGIIRREPTEETSLENWNQVLSTNLTAAFLMTRHVVSAMRAARKGSIVNVASRAAKRPHRNASPSYGASKAGLIYLTRHVAFEFAPYGIRANAVCPGPVETDMFRKIDPERKRQITAEIPLGRAASPEEVADLILYLAGPRSAYITGEAVNINGGSFMD